jgi:hypothetical protein
MSDSTTSCVQARAKKQVRFFDDDFYDCEDALHRNVFANTGRDQQNANFIGNRKSLGCTCKTVAEMKSENKCCNTCFVDFIYQDVCNLKRFEANYGLTEAEQEEY